MPESTNPQMEPGFVQRLMSTLTDRMHLAAKAGVQFGGLRNLYEVFGYRTSIGFENYLAKYQRQDIAARIIDAPAAALWRDPPKITGDGGGFNDAWETHTKEVQLWRQIERVDKLCGLGRYAVLLLGVGGTPANAAAVRNNELIYMKPLGEGAAEISKFEEDVTNPRYSLPSQYQLSLRINQDNRAGASASAGRSVEVHHSRVLHVVENPLESEVYGSPRLSRVYNLLDDLLKVVGGAAETFWLTGNRGIQANVDPEMDLSAADAEALSDVLDEYMHQLRRVIKTRGVDLNVLESNPPDPTGVSTIILALIAGATGIPQRILMGAEAGQLASEQDRANWAERIRERQTSFGEAGVIRPYIGHMVRLGLLPDPGDIEIEWGDPFHMSPLEQAQMFAQRGRAIAAFSRQWQYGAPIITQEEAREFIGLPGTGGPEQTFGALGQDPPEPEDDDDDNDNDNDNRGGPAGAGPNATIRGPSDL